MTSEPKTISFLTIGEPPELLAIAEVKLLDGWTIRIRQRCDDEEQAIMWFTEVQELLQLANIQVE